MKQNSQKLDPSVNENLANYKGNISNQQGKRDHSVNGFGTTGQLFGGWDGSLPHLLFQNAFQKDKIFEHKKMNAQKH